VLGDGERVRHVQVVRLVAVRERDRALVAADEQDPERIRPVQRADDRVAGDDASVLAVDSLQLE
jgi:hypothetical protein